MIEDMDDLMAEKIEIDENLQHTELTKLQESQQALRRRQIWEEENGKITSGKHIASSPDVGEDSFMEMMCRLLGKSQAGVYDIINVARDLDQDAQETIVGLPICENRAELKRLAEFPDDVQQGIVAQLKSGEITKVPKWDEDVEDEPFDTDEPEHEEYEEEESEYEPTEPGEPGKPAAPKPNDIPWDRAVNIAIREIKKETVRQLDTLDDYDGRLASVTRSSIMHWIRSISTTLTELKDKT